MTKRIILFILTVLLLFTFAPLPTYAAQTIAPTEATTVSNTGLSSFAIQPDGSLWAWGANHFGQLGIGSVTPLGRFHSTPTRKASNMIAVTGAVGHTLVLHEGGHLTMITPPCS